MVTAPSVSGLSGTLKASVPALLAKVAHLRPHVFCLNGKEMWKHIKGALQQRLLLKQESDSGVPSGSMAIPLKEEEVEVPVRLKVEEEKNQEKFAFGLQPYKAVHNVVSKASDQD